MRESLSAELDGEALPVTRGALDRHLAGCPGCRAWLAGARRLADVLPAAPPPPDGSAERVLARVQATARRPRRRLAAVRRGLAAVALVQLLTTWPQLLLGQDHDAPLHVAHELGSLTVAVAVGLLAAAAQPALARGMLPMVGTAGLLLAVTAGADVSSGHTDLADELPHGLVLVGFLLLWLLTRLHRNLGGAAAVPAGPPLGPPAQPAPPVDHPRWAFAGHGAARLRHRRWRIPSPTVSATALVLLVGLTAVVAVVRPALA